MKRNKYERDIFCNILCKRYLCRIYNEHIRLFVPDFKPMTVDDIKISERNLSEAKLGEFK